MVGLIKFIKNKYCTAFRSHPLYAFLFGRLYFLDLERLTEGVYLL